MTSRKLRSTNAARSDLSDIWFFVAQGDVAAANRAVDRIADGQARLLDYPESGPIGDFIAARDPRAAVRLVEAFRAKWRTLADHPHSGRLRDDLSPGLRQAVVVNYLTLYRVTHGVVTIVRAMDGRRNLGPPDVD